MSMTEEIIVFNLINKQAKQNKNEIKNITRRNEMEIKRKN